MVVKYKGNGFSALRVEGGILPVEYLQSIAGLNEVNQKGADYGLSKSLAIKEEIARFWRIASDLYNLYCEHRDRSDLDRGEVGMSEWLIPLLRDVLGFADLTSIGEARHGERFFKISHQACGNAVPMLLLTSDYDLDKADARLGYEGRRQAPHSLMQEYLNAGDNALWGLVVNGSKMRILRDNASLTRPSCIEADLDLMFGEELYSDFATLWLTAHASRFQPLEGKASHCIIESWRSKAHETGERIREDLREGVTEALRQLGNGFLQHPANKTLLESLEVGKLRTEQYFEQLLRLVYRMLFLFTVEERELLHLPEVTDEQKKIYQQGYAISLLRERALRRRHYDHNVDLWLGLLITIRACDKGETLLKLPALGGLFRTEQCPDLDQAMIANENLLEAVRSLAFFRSEKNKTLVRVNYRNMDTEELGSVYESLLELQPRIDANQKPLRFSFLSDDAGDMGKGSVRKLTGSYYTPPSLVNELIKSTLEPVIENVLAANPQNPVAAILGLRVIDPACGSGHFLLAAARRLADEITRIEKVTNLRDESSRQHALREVVRHCIYGVDRNPLAVELCKTSLWMETVEPGKPLTFLDGQIVLGDSLVGVLDPNIIAGGIPDKAFDPLTGDNKEVSKQLKKRNREKHTQDLFDQDAVLSVALAGIDLDAMPEETLEEVDQKRAARDSFKLGKQYTHERFRADLYTGAFFAPKKDLNSMELSPLTGDLDMLAGGLPLRKGLEGATRRLAKKHRFLHWHLEFAEIMQDGGFDAVLGNPPWGRIKLQEKKFFASRSPSIADAPNSAARNRLIQLLNRPNAEHGEKKLYRNFLQAKREAEATSQFVRTSGRFPLAGVGDVNTYAVFAETFLRLIKPHGRAGLIVPSGIAIDDTTKRYFQHLVEQQRLVSLFDFENREAVFPGVHRSYKFCLLTLTGMSNPVCQAEFAFFLHQPEHLKELERRFTLAASDFALFNPNTRTCPIFRTRRDMEIARKMYQRAGVLWKEENESQEEINPWGIRFSRMFDMSNDSGLFHTRETLENNGYRLAGNIFVRSENEERYLPLYEAKLFHQYDHRFATFDGVSHKDLDGGNARTVTADEKSDPTSVVIPRYWVSEEEVQIRLDKSKKSTKLEPNRTEPNRTEPNRTEPNRTEPNRTEPNRTEPNRTEPNRTEPNRTEPNRTEPNRTEPNRTEPNRTEPNRTEPNRTEPNRTEPNRTEPNRTEPNRTEPNRTERLYSISSPSWPEKHSPGSRMGDCVEADYDVNQPKNRDFLNHSIDRAWSQRGDRFTYPCTVQFRKTARATDERTLITTPIRRVGMSDRAPLIRFATDETAPLFVALFNSFVVDFAARSAVGGTDLSFFTIKQLPILHPARFKDQTGWGCTYADFIVPRVLELVYTSSELQDFAENLGYDDQPFPWNDVRRFRLKCEIDAALFCIYGLGHDEIDYIMETFPIVKRDDVREFGDFRTKYLILEIYDEMKAASMTGTASTNLLIPQPEIAL